MAMYRSDDDACDLEVSTGRVGIPGVYMEAENPALPRPLETLY
jgi:hypothetical protein